MINKTGQAAKAIINENSNLVTIVKGILISYVVTIPIFLVFAYILTFTSFPEKHIPTAVIITTIISIVVAGSSSTKNIFPAVIIEYAI